VQLPAAETREVVPGRSPDAVQSKGVHPKTHLHSDLVVSKRFSAITGDLAQCRG